MTAYHSNSTGFESSDEEDSRQPALPVDIGNLEESDLSLPPTNGMEYLRRVVAEAKQCPKVVVAKIDRQQFAGNQTYSLHHSECNLPSTPDTFRMRPEWQKQQFKMFHKVRQEFQRLKEDDGFVVARQKLPNKDSELDWCRFCHGNSIASAAVETIPSSASSPARENETPSPQPRSPGTEWVQGERPAKPEQAEAMDCATETDLTGLMPTTSLVMSLDHPVLEQLIEWHLEWLGRGLPVYTLGPWLYSLLVGLEKPVTPEMSHVLRDLARTCIRLRAACRSNHEQNVPYYSLFICLVARFFDQSDLGD